MRGQRCITLRARCDPACHSTKTWNSCIPVQVVDDILDVTQTTEMLGKTAAKDLAVNKTTYPKLLGIEKSRKVGRGWYKWLDCIFFS